MMTTPNSTPPPIRVMLVDDHKTMLWGLERLIESARPPMEVVGTASSPEEMLEQASLTAPEVILLDLDLGGRNATEDLPHLLERTQAHVLVLTADTNPDSHHQAILRGARGVVCKNEVADVILRAIERVHEGEVWINRNLMGRLLGTMASPARSRPPNLEAGKIASLTAREREIVATVVRERGAKSVAIAERLGISEHTLRNHLTVIYSKLGLRNRIELFLYASEHKLVPEE